MFGHVSVVELEILVFMSVFSSDFSFPTHHSLLWGLVGETNLCLTGVDCATTRVSHAASRGIYHRPEKNEGLSVCTRAFLTQVIY